MTKTQLKSHASELISVFDNSCQYEKTFLKMKYIKFYCRSALIDEYLLSILMIGNMNFESQRSKMVASPANNDILLINKSVLQKKMFLIIVIIFKFHHKFQKNFYVMTDYSCVIAKILTLGP